MMDYDTDPVTFARFASQLAIRNIPPQDMFDLIFRLAENDRMTDAEFRQFIRTYY